MQPAVVVATNFNGLPNGNPGYQNDVLNRVIPFVEANFNVSHNAADRAFGGLSAGGSRANQLIFNATTVVRVLRDVEHRHRRRAGRRHPAVRQPGSEEAARAGRRRRALRLDHGVEGDAGGAPDGQRRAVHRRHDRRRPRVVHVAQAAARLRGRRRLPDDHDRGDDLGHLGDRDRHARHDRAGRADGHGAVLRRRHAARRAGRRWSAARPRSRVSSTNGAARSPRPTAATRSTTRATARRRTRRRAGRRGRDRAGDAVVDARRSGLVRRLHAGRHEGLHGLDDGERDLDRG